MTLPQFTAALGAELRSLGEPFAFGDLLEYAAAIWPQAREDLDAGRWARAFLEARLPA